MKKIGRNKNRISTKVITAADTNQLMQSAIQIHLSGQLHEAELQYRQVIALQPRHADALHYLGVIAYQKGQCLEAEQLITLAIAENPTNASYFSNLGVALRDQGKFQQAITSHRRALELNPEYVEAYTNLGVALVDDDEIDQGIECYQQALARNPDYIVALDNLGVLWRLKGRFDESIVLHQRVLQLDPSYLVAYTNLAASYIEIEQMELATAQCQKVLELNPSYVEAYVLLSQICDLLGYVDETLPFMTKAIQLDPHNKNMHNILFRCALYYLRVGNLEEGWKQYENRWLKHPDPVLKRIYPFPYWQGESLADKTIFVFVEQGIGDQIMFSSMYAELVALSKRAILGCAPKMIPLLRRSFPGADIIDIDDAAEVAALDQAGIDVQSAAGSLCMWLRPTVASFPQRDAFLTPNPERVAYWKSRLAELGPGLCVGISWRSGNMKGNRPLYCTSIEQWQPIFSIPGIHFVNLQYDECADELNYAREHFFVDIHAFSEVDLYNDLDEAAALTSALDLVISAPTTAAILSAALGVMTWEIMRGLEWQYFGTDKNCFYSNLQVFHKKIGDEWDATINDVAVQLKQVVNAKLVAQQ